MARAAIARDSEDFKVAIREVTNAYYAAHGDADQITEIEALRWLLYWIGTDQEDAAGVEQWYRLGLAEVNRFQAISPMRTVLLRNALVGVALTRNEAPVAIEQARLAVAALESGGPTLLRATATREYAGALAESGDAKHALPIYQQAVDLLVTALGPDDPNVAMVLGDQALTYSEAGQDAEAVVAGERAMAIVDKQATRTIEGANIQLNFASVLIEADKPERAEALLRASRETFEKALGPDNPTIATIDSNLALLENDRGNHQAGAALLRSAIAIQEKSLGPDHPDVAASLFNLAAALKETPDLTGALAAAARSAEIRAKAIPNSDFHVYSLVMKAAIENQLGKYEDALRDASMARELGAPHGDFQTVAWPKLEQARALLSLHRDPTIVKRLLDEARTAYEANHMTKRVAEIDALLAPSK
jgi:tetratricopeptide (TPR) repeat protein